jgi:hypothetical protein
MLTYAGVADVCWGAGQVACDHAARQHTDVSTRGKHDDAILLRIFFQEGNTLWIAGRDENQAAPDQRRPS